MTDGTWCALSAMRTVPPPKTISLKESEKDRRRIGAGCTLIIGKLSISSSALGDFRKWVCFCPCCASIRQSVPINRVVWERASCHFAHRSGSKFTSP